MRHGSRCKISEGIDGVEVYEEGIGYYLRPAIGEYRDMRSEGNVSVSWSTLAHTSNCNRHTPCVAHGFEPDFALHVSQ